MTRFTLPYQHSKISLRRRARQANLLRAAAQPVGEMMRFEGILRIRRLPEEWTHEEFLYWWCPTSAPDGTMIRPARIPEREKERYTELEAHNMLMTAGRAQILTYIGASSGNSTGFSKYLAIGTGLIQAPSPVDILLNNEVIRKALSAFTLQGTQVDMNFQLTSGDANVTMTEAGLFGGAATGTAHSGTLYTHALFSYTKGAYSIAVDYLANLF